MLDQTVMLKVEAAAQAAQLPSMAGKTFTVAKTVTAGDGISKWLVLLPQGGASKAAEGVVVLKVEGGRQLMGNLVGQTFTVGKAPLVGKGAGSWLVLQPKAAGATGVKALLSGTGFAGQDPLTGGVTAKLVNGVVAMPPVDPTLTMAAVKGIEIEGAGAAAAMSKGAVAKGVGGAAAVKGGGAALGGTAGGAAGGAAASVATKGAGAAAGSGTLWSGTGTSLGLGLGLGAWGPVILVGAMAAVGVGIYSYVKNRQAADAVGELHEAMS